MGHKETTDETIRIIGGYLFGAGDRTRTGTSFTSRDFKSLVSTYSTTPATGSMVSHFLLCVKSHCGNDLLNNCFQFRRMGAVNGGAGFLQIFFGAEAP